MYDEVVELLDCEGDELAEDEIVLELQHDDE